MKRPARLPASPEDLAEWTVYADWLQGEGDPRGEAIAYELAGASGESRDYAGIRAVSRLGHIYALVVPRDIYTVTADTLARARALIGSDDAALLEEVEVPLEPLLADDVERLFAALPASCRRVAIDLCNPISDDAARTLLDALPGHVREIALASSGFRLRIVGLTGLARWIDDRFDAVELRYTRSTWDVALGQMDVDRDAIARRLAATSRVRLQMTIADAADPSERVEIGGPDDAAVVDLRRRCAMVLSTRASHRRIDGKIRARFTVGLYPRRQGPITTGDWAEVVFQRAGDDWWVQRGSSQYGAQVRVDGVELAADSTLEIGDGGGISSDHWDYVLVTHDVTPTVRALLG